MRELLLLLGNEHNLSKVLIYLGSAPRWPSSTQGLGREVQVTEGMEATVSYNVDLGM